MDLFEQLRREHEFGIGTIAGVAAKFGVHRRVVRRAIASALPPPHHDPERSKPKLGALEPFIERVLEEDRRAPRKQRHTALVRGYTGGYRSHALPPLGSRRPHGCAQ